MAHTDNNIVNNDPVELLDYISAIENELCSKKKYVAYATRRCILYI